MSSLASTPSARSFAHTATSLRSSATAGRVLSVVARIALGALFLVCGLDGFFHFIPMPTEPPPAGAMAFGGALIQTGYMFPLIKGTEVLAGTLLLLNRKVPLALVLLAPVAVNIFAFHLFLAPEGLGVAAAIVLAGAYLAWAHRAAFRTLLAS